MSVSGVNTVEAPAPDRFAVHHLPDAEVFIARSTSTDRLYFVICHDGHATCTCPATKTCKHIRRVQAAQASRVEHGYAGPASLLVSVDVQATQARSKT